MLQRIATALFGAPIILLVAWMGGIYLAAAIAVMLLLIQQELLQLLKAYSLHRGMVFFGGLAIAIAGYWTIPGEMTVVWTGLLLFYLLLAVGLFPKLPPSTLGATLLLVFYPGMLVYLNFIRFLPEGLKWIVIVLLTTWAFDIFGYLVGKRFGNKLMVPELSPKKTWEGFAGGVFAAVITAVFAGSLWMDTTAVGSFALLGLICALFAQSGDLFASALKRQVGAKDSGSLLPGHGGLLDRFDSLLFAAPVAYYYIQWALLGG